MGCSGINRLLLRLFLPALLLNCISVAGYTNLDEEPPTWVADQPHFAAPGSGNYCFIENRGQLSNDKGKPADEVRYYLQMPGVTLYFTDKAVIYDFVKYQFTSNVTRNDKTRFDVPSVSTTSAPQTTIEAVSHFRVDMEFTGTSSKQHILGKAEQGSTNNYFIGTERFSNVKSYNSICYKEIYKGIDLVFYIQPNGKGIKYDFIVKPGANPSQIRYCYKGAESVKLNESGRLDIATSLGQITEDAPVSYQESETSKSPVESRFILSSGNLCFFTGEYDKSKPLIIDPGIIVWATYYGGNGSTEEGTHLVTDSNGDIIVSGRTTGSNFPTSTGASQASSAGNQDGFVIKFSSSGTRIWGTYFGGSLTDTPRSCGVDASGNIFVIGITQSLNIPLLNPGGGAWYQPVNTACTINPLNITAFIVKLTAAGALTWSTYLGGSVGESGVDLWIDSGNNLLVTGCTASQDFPVTAGAFQTTNNGPVNTTGAFGDVFLTKFTNAGVLTWSTLCGGSQDEIGYGVTTDNSDNIYICGWTVSANFPVSGGAFQSTNGGGTGDAFIAKFSPAGARIWATYFGGSGTQRTLDCVFNTNFLYVCGYSVGSLPGPSTGVFQPANAGGLADGYIVKLDPQASNASQVIWRTFIGGSGDDGMDEITKDNSGNLISGGYTNSSNYPASVNAYQSTLGGEYDGQVIILDQNAQAICATYFGRINKDNVYGLSAAPNGDILITGNTANTQADGFPITAGAFQSVKGTGLDAYLARITNITIVPVSAFVASPANGCAPLVVNATNNSVSNNTCLSTTTYLWSFPGGAPASSTLQIPPPVTYSNAGTYTITLLVTNAAGNHSSTQTVTVGASDASWSLPASRCENSSPLDLTTGVTGSPGGTFSGTGVTGTSFDPSGLSGPIVITYTVGAGACQTQEPITITITNLPQPTVSGPLSYCAGDIISPLNATNAQQFQVNWYSDQALTNLVSSGSTFTPPAVSATYYSVFSSNGCSSAPSPVTLSFISSPLPAWSLPATLCANSAQLDLEPLITGTAGGNFSGTGVNGTIFDPVGLSGIVSITYTVGTGTCMATEVHDVLLINLPTPLLPDSVSYCNGEQPGNLTVTAQAGETITWYSDAALQNSVFTGAVFTPPATNATYFVAGSLNGCNSPPASVSVSFSNPAPPVGDSVIFYCPGTPLPMLTFTSAAGIVTWFSDENLTSQLQTGTAYQVTTGQSELWVVSVLGNCTSRPIHILISGASSNQPVISGNMQICPGETTTAHVDAPLGNEFSYQWQQQIGSGGFTNITNNGTYNGATTPALTISANDASLAGTELRCLISGICPLPDSSNVLLLNITEGPKLASQPDCPISCTGIPPVLQFLVSGPVDAYQWEILEPSGAYSQLLNTEYFSGVDTNRLTVTPADELNGRIVRCRVTGCGGFVYTDTVLLKFPAAYPVYIPTAFTPDDAPENTVFKIYTVGNPEFTAVIYNRWGEELYQWNTVDSGWDGTYSGRLVQDGMYIYRVKFNSACDKQVITGSVLVIR